MDALTQFDRLSGPLGDVISRIGPDDLDRPTPCADFTVAGVLGHMVGGATQFAAAYRGEEAEAPEQVDVLADIGPALTRLGDAIAAPGALQRTVQAPFGAVDGDTFARFIVLDGIVHGWDLATATGQAYEPDAALVAAVEAFARTAVDPLRDGATFAAAVDAPEGASAIERLVAFTGRHVLPPSGTAPR